LLIKKSTKIVSKLLLNHAILEICAKNQKNGLKTGVLLNVKYAHTHWKNTHQIHTSIMRRKKKMLRRMLMLMLIKHSSVDNAIYLSILRRNSIIVTNGKIVKDFITRNATLRTSFLNSPSWEVLILINKGNGVNTLN